MPTRRQAALADCLSPLQSVTVLRIVDTVDREPEPQTTVWSIVVSLMLHATLALVLWSIAYVTIKHEPVFLTASQSKPAVVDVPLQPVEETGTAEQPPGLDGSAVIEPSEPLDLWVPEVTQSEAMADEVQGSMEPPSIEFFGTRAYGNRFVFVLDVSYSMNAREGARFDRACDELLRSVSQLSAGQSYYVLLFCWRTEEMFYNPSIDYVQVTADHVENLRRWIYDVSLGPGTDPRRALSLACQMNPDAVFLLSDGHFNEPSTPQSDSGWFDKQGKRIKSLNVQQGVERFFQSIPIHTTALENPFTYVAMEKIAKATGGRYRYVKTSSHRPIDSQRFLTALRHIDQKHRKDVQPYQEYQSRLSHAREFMIAGELVYAEYLIRPLRRAHRSKIANPVLLDQILSILDAELGSTRLEDFEPAPELIDIVSTLP